MSDVLEPKFKHKQRGLGRGLANLLSSTVPASSETGKAAGTVFRVLSLNQIEVAKQPRETFDERLLDELTESIREHGVLQPIIVNPTDKPGIFRIIAGERRYRASKKAGLTSIPVVIKGEKLSKDQAYELALIENIQRADLTPVEEAKAYQVLLDAYSWSQETLAKRVGKDRSSISNTIRLLRLHPNVLKALDEGVISSGHAKILCSIPFEQQLDLFNEARQKKLSVRALEDLVQVHQIEVRRKAKKKNKLLNSLDPQYQKIVKNIEESLSVRVQLQPVNKQRGRIILHYHDVQVLNSILEKLAKS